VIRRLKIWQILVSVGTLIFFLSGAFPLISIHFIGIFSISLFDLYKWFGYGLPISEFPSEWTPALSSVVAGFLLIAILFPVTVIVGFVSVRLGPKACLIAGSLGMVCWLGSLFAVIQLKLLVAQLAGPLGGLAASFIHIGYGVYGGILSSVILLISYFVAVHETKKAAGSPSNLPS
jgi:hypothetical protein